jgi:serine/threonine protein kinase
MTQEEFFSRYKYDRTKDRIGGGGFGNVYKVFDTIENETAALKIAEVKQGQESLSLLKEVELASSLKRHVNIARYTACCRYDLPNGHFDFGLLQYYPLGNLSQLVKSKKLTHNEKEQIAKGVIYGIEHLHNNNIVHRDLKSANILIAEGYQGEYVPKIADFGLSKQFAQNENSYFSNSFAGGSLLYVAPEQLEGRELRKNVDLWSLGVVLYELFVGVTPFKASVDDGSETARAEIISKIRNATLPASITSVPYIWQEIIRVCLVTNPSNRVKSIEEVQDIVNGKTNLKYESGITEVDNRSEGESKIVESYINKGNKNKSKKGKPISGLMIFLLISLVLSFMVWWVLSTGSQSAPDNKTKDKFYFGVADYLRKKNPNISQEEILSKVEEFRQNPEQYYADSYKELTGKTIDKKTLQKAAEYDNITIDLNNISFPPSEIADNFKGVNILVEESYGVFYVDDNKYITFKPKEKGREPELNGIDKRAKIQLSKSNEFLNEYSGYYISVYDYLNSKAFSGSARLEKIKNEEILFVFWFSGGANCCFGIDAYKYDISKSAYILKDAIDIRRMEIFDDIKYPFEISKSIRGGYDFSDGGRCAGVNYLEKLYFIDNKFRFVANGNIENLEKCFADFVYENKAELLQKQPSIMSNLEEDTNIHNSLLDILYDIYTLNKDINKVKRIYFKYCSDIERVNNLWSDSYFDN